MTVSQAVPMSSYEFLCDSYALSMHFLCDFYIGSEPIVPRKRPFSRGISRPQAAKKKSGPANERATKRQLWNANYHSLTLIHLHEQKPKDTMVGCAWGQHGRYALQ